jgi:hypothetical protein
MQYYYRLPIIIIIISSIIYIGFIYPPSPTFFLQSVENEPIYYYVS